MIDLVGSVGIQLMLGIIYIAVIAIPAWITDKISDRFYDNERKESRLGCLTQLVIFSAFAALLFIALQPAKQALTEAACRGSDDYTACIDSDEAATLEYDRR